MLIWCQIGNQSAVKCDANMVSNMLSILDISKICSVYVIRIHIKKMKAKLEAKLEADYCPNTLRRYPTKTSLKNVLQSMQRCREERTGIH